MTDVVRPSNERAPLEHELKAWPPFYARLADGSKTFELRWNDRDYRAGDTLHIIEFNPESECYTGCSLKRRISYVMEGGQFGLEPGWVALALTPETPDVLWWRIASLRGAVERIGLFHSDMNIPRECMEILKDDEQAHNVPNLKASVNCPKCAGNPCECPHQWTAAKAGERREYHANGTYWSGVPTVDMPCDFCKLAITDHDPRTHACPPLKAGA